MIHRAWSRAGYVHYMPLFAVSSGSVYGKAEQLRCLLEALGKRSTSKVH